MDWIKIRKEYESSEISLSDLAVKHGIKYSTVKSRNQREKWTKGASEIDASKAKASKAKADASINASKKTQDASRGKVSKRDPKIKTILNNREIKIDGNTDLTEKQSLFCLYYVKYWSATKAYQKAYECGYNTANVEGFKNLVKPSVKKEIDRLKKNIREGVVLEVMAVLQKYIDIAFADIGDFLSFGQRDIPVMNMFGPVYEGEGKDKKAVLKTVNFIDLKAISEVDGTLISEVKQGKDGVSIKLADKMKALEKLEQFLDLLPDKHKRRIEDEKLKLEQAKFELEKKKVDDPGAGDENADDGFIDALAGKTNEAWRNDANPDGMTIDEDIDNED